VQAAAKKTVFPAESLSTRRPPGARGHTRSAKGDHPLCLVGLRFAESSANKYGPGGRSNIFDNGVQGCCEILGSHPPAWLADGTDALMGSMTLLGFTTVAFFEASGSTAAWPHERHYDTPHDQSKHSHVLMGIALGTLARKSCAVALCGESARLQDTGSPRVVRLWGESPGRVIVPLSCSFPREIRSCPMYCAAPGGSGTRARAFKLESCLRVPWVASGLPSLPPVRDKTSPRRQMWSHTGSPILQVTVICLVEAMSRNVLLQLPNTVYPISRLGCTNYFLFLHFTNFF
jgi:hypothetical protein